MSSKLTTIETTCRTCASVIEIETSVKHLETGDMFTLPANEEITCPYCNRVHPAYTPMRVVEIKTEYKAMKAEVTDEKETLTLYPIDEKEGNDIAVVSIGHIDYRARFRFNSNKDALDCYNALLKIIDMGIE